MSIVHHTIKKSSERFNDLDSVECDMFMCVFAVGVRWKTNHKKDEKEKKNWITEKTKWVKDIPW